MVLITLLLLLDSFHPLDPAVPYHDSQTPPVHGIFGMYETLGAIVIPVREGGKETFAREADGHMARVVIQLNPSSRSFEEHSTSSRTRTRSYPL